MGAPGSGGERGWRKRGNKRVERSRLVAEKEGV